MRVPDFDPSLLWLNSAPLSFHKELRGKIVLLDFWTYCCINCLHVLPEIAELERAFAGKPVVFIGVHSAKFANEQDVGNLRQALLRYDIHHPVVSDPKHLMWQALGVRGWPTLALIDPAGNLLYKVSGEGQGTLLHNLIEEALEQFATDLDPTPLPMLPEKAPPTPLLFPGKIAIDGERLVISDTGHHRVLLCTLLGKCYKIIEGFHAPQGVVLIGNRLFIADTGNHAFAMYDLATERLTALAKDLSSPWDLCYHEGKLYIALAGRHQIWVHDLQKGRTEHYSGSGAEANYNSDNPHHAAWAQPSGLTVSGHTLFIADSESSTIRTIDLHTGATDTLVGGDPLFPHNLFAFGDIPGVGTKAKLQHPLGVCWDQRRRRVVVADTYNHRLKLLDPATREIVPFAGTGEAGFQDGPLTEARFYEPSGVAVTPDGRLYVADTNNHAIRIVDGNEVTTLTLEGI